ncbi:PGC-1 and ERR-induced regulator in muscle protein 1 [Rhinatrema bivittatum]|uniref:PGC-1 and ERR-induced regulator in muscle protein 1 n=1 Tax=Rhinatrema bivittatum TaxID=194408 RepID=UPI00112BF8D1|nr:PGC-1 and ERR-induced regulator in muscle protein 1 [Rhinatrema bivittatum]
MAMTLLRFRIALLYLCAAGTPETLCGMDNFEYSIELNDRDWAEFYFMAEECDLLQASLATTDEQTLSDPEQGEVTLSTQTDQKVKRVRVNLCSALGTWPPCPILETSGPNPTAAAVLSGSEDEADLESVSRFLWDRGTPLLCQQSGPSSSGPASSHKAHSLGLQLISLNGPCELGPDRGERQDPTLGGATFGAMKRDTQPGSRPATSSSSSCTQGRDSSSEKTAHLHSATGNPAAQLPEVTLCSGESASTFSSHSADSRALLPRHSSKQDGRARPVKKIRDPIHVRKVRLISEAAPSETEQREGEPDTKQSPTNPAMKSAPANNAQSLGVFMGALQDASCASSFPPPLKEGGMNGRAAVPRADESISKAEGVFTGQEVDGEDQESYESSDGQRFSSLSGPPAQSESLVMPIAEICPVSFCEIQQKAAREGSPRPTTGRAPGKEPVGTFSLPGIYEYFFHDEEKDENNDKELILRLPALASEDLAVKLKSLMSSQVHLPSSRLQGSRSQSQGQKQTLFQGSLCASGEEPEAKSEDLETAVAVTGKRPLQFSLGHSDLCLVLFAFASWVANSSSVRTADAWKAALIANIGAISVIRYCRRHAGAERWQS